MDPMRFLIVSALTPQSPSGVRVYYQRLEAELGRRGHSVRTITPDNAPRRIRLLTGAIRRCLSLLGSDWYEIAMALKSFGRLFWACKGLQRNFDIIHAQDAGSAVAAGFATRWQLPVLLTCHCFNDAVPELTGRSDTSALPPLFLERWFRWLYRKVSFFICPSKYVMERVRSSVASGAVLELIPHGVPFRELAGAVPDRPLAESSAGKSVVLNAGRLEPHKGQMLLVETAAALHRDDVVFWIAGDGPEATRIAEEVRKRGLERRVVLLGHRNDLPSVMKTSTIYVHAATQETFGLVLLEAMACGLPVFAMRTGGVPEVLQGTESESLFPRETTPAELARLIEGWVQDREKLRHLARKQFEDARNRFDVAVMVEQTLAFYSRAVALWPQFRPGGVNPSVKSVEEDASQQRS